MMKDQNRAGASGAGSSRVFPWRTAPSTGFYATKRVTGSAVHYGLLA